MSTTRKNSSDSRKPILYATLGVVVLAIIVVVGYYSRPAAAPPSAAAPSSGVKVGQAAPDFTLSTTAGPFQLSKETDEPTLLEVFATWCPHCQRETVVLNQAYDRFKDKVHFVSVNGSSFASETDENIPESQANVIGFGQRFGVKYPIAFDQDLTVGNIYLDKGGFPTLVLIGRNGKVQSVHSGELPPDLLETALAASATGKTPDPAFGVKDPAAN